MDENKEQEQKINDKVIQDDNKQEETVAVSKGKFTQFLSSLFGEEEKSDKLKKDIDGREIKKPVISSSDTKGIDVTTLLATERAKWETEQAEKAKLDRLPDSEKIKAEAEGYKQKLAEVERTMTERTLRDEVIGYLNDEGYPIELADCMAYSSKEAKDKSLANITKAFEKSLEVAMKARIKGKTPEGLGVTGSSNQGSMQGMIAQSIRGGLR